MLQCVRNKLGKRFVLIQTGKDNTDRIEREFSNRKVGAFALFKQLANLLSPLLIEQQFQPKVRINEELHQPPHHSSAFF